MQPANSQPPRLFRQRRLVPWLCAWGLLQLSLPAAQLVPVPALGLRVARGFQVTLFADEKLANDIYAMTLDSRGNVVVSGQGYIRTLLDQNLDGVADASVEFARTPSGGMGLCFDGTDLLFVGDDALWRFRDANDDGQADGPPERLLSLNGGEHGGHAIRKGPDGGWYVIGGNDTKFSPAEINLSSLPAQKIEGGALLRLRADGHGAEVVAHGFRNPYDFDFNREGELFTYDSDVEGDYFLPWYTPTRLYHIAPEGHHGWRLEGYKRSWARPDYYVDTVSILEELGRGSPTGIACYDHLQFPPYYRDGLFVLDWTFGRVLFLPLQPSGSSYQTSPEVFLESIGTHGFAPTDIAVGQDGSLFLCAGGRKSRGAVYRIQYIADPLSSIRATNWLQISSTEAQAAVSAPQPLEAWSRAWWMPLAKRAGPRPFEILVVDNRAPAEQRIRAIEILTEVHGGLAPDVAAGCAQAGAPPVRARVAWSLGVVPAQNFEPILLGLARDLAPSVRVHALEALRREAGNLAIATIQQALAANLAHPDKRVRQAAALLATTLPDPAWKALWAQQSAGPPQARLSATLALLWRSHSSEVNTTAVETALTLLNQTRLPDLRAQALRLILIGLGDFQLEKPSLEVYTAYEPGFSLAAHPVLISRLQKALATLFPSGDRIVDFETARLLAMIEASDPGLPGKVVARFNDFGSPSDDFHYLTVFSKLKTAAVTNFTAWIAQAVLRLDRKLDGLQQRPQQNWPSRLAELVGALIKHDSNLADAMMRHPDFARPAHLPLVPLLGSTRYLACARLYLNAVRSTPGFPWTEPLVELLSALPPEEVHPLLRKQLANVVLRDRLLIELAPKPQLEDRDKFVAGLESARPEVVRASLTALLQLPNDTTTRAHVATLRLLRRLLHNPGDSTTRAQTLLLLSRLSGQKFDIQEKEGDLTRIYQPVFDWFALKYPGILRQLDADDQENPAQWEAFYKTVPWTRGDTSRGETLFVERGCQGCHSGARPIGPDLGGVARRLSVVDLFNAILFPSRDIAAPYRMTTFHLRDGSRFTGLVAFESADGVIVQTAAAATVRLAESDITSREPSTVSFMPSGLLVGLKAQDFADLYAYLKALPAQGEPPRFNDRALGP